MGAKQTFCARCVTELKRHFAEVENLLKTFTGIMRDIRQNPDTASSFMKAIETMIDKGRTLTQGQTSLLNLANALVNAGSKSSASSKSTGSRKSSSNSK